MLQAVTPNAPCKVCGKPFIRFSTFESAVICGAKRCLSGYVKGLDKTRKDDLKRRKEAVKTRSEVQNETQKACNDFVRTRDAGKPCVSCGKPDDGIRHASHFRSVGSSPALRFDEANIHAACHKCNLFLHGNLIPYRAELVRRVGQSEVDRLEGPHEPKKYTIAELQDLKSHYRALTRQLLKEKT